MINILCFNLHQFDHETLIYDNVMSLTFLLNWMFSVANSKYILCSTFKLYSDVEICGLDLTNSPPLYIL